MIKLVDAMGNARYVRRQGKLGLTKHKRVMSALELRALRYRRKGQPQEDADEALYQEALDETETVSTANLTDSDDSSAGTITTAEATYLEEEELAGINDDLLTIHGVAPGPKAEGVSRLVYENLDGINTRISGNEKLEKAKEINDELKVDIAAYNEHQINPAHKDNVNGLSQMFNGGEAEIRSLMGNNTHENVGRRQQGGTGLLLYGPLIQQYDFEASGKDDAGLGRWVVMTLRGSDGIVTRIVCAYNPCKSAKKATRSSYQQHRRYFLKKEKDRTCPRTRFREDLIRQLKKWRDEGDRLIVCMDANENIYKKSIGKALTDSEGLGMQDVVRSFTGEKIGATFFRGSTPIDCVWATSDVIVTGACVMPAGYGVGDHRLFVIDFLTASIVGSRPPRVVRSGARRLNSNIEPAALRYEDKLEDQVVRNNVIQRVGKVHETSRSKEEVKRRLDKIDNETKQYQKGAERRCRRIKSGRIPFSPESSKWIRRAQVYRSVLRYHAGKIGNRANLKRAARRCGISSPLRLSLEEVRARLKVCKEKCNYYKKHGHRHRRKHLRDRLSKARASQDEEAEKRILAIISREKQRAYWRRLNYAVKKPKGRSARVVTTEELGEGEITEHAGQSAVEQAIWNGIHRQRFYLAEQAPICKGEMREAFGYLATTIAAKQVLAGTYDYPADFDEATREICEVCAAIRLGVPARSVNSKIERREWAARWAKAKEQTSSSESGLHFGHYKVAARSPLLSHMHALKTSLALRRGVALDRWSRGLSVMLEKMYGCTLVNKLRAILLMEADFNFSNKVIYGVRMMDNARNFGYMPEEVYSEQGRTADDGSLAKVLFYDIVRQSRVAAGLASIDAANCYDSIAHAIASLVFQAFGVPEEAIESMLTAIEEMKYFLRTAYGDSRDFVGSTIDVKFQGLCQGNGAAPAGWAVISITVLQAHKQKGHGAKFVCPISDLSGHLAAILYVDDTDILHIDLEQNQNEEEAHEALQASVTNWGKLLIATGGAFKPPKCFYHIISFRWRRDGSWAYSDNEQREDLEVTVPMPNGTMVPIDHYGVDEGKETLGVYTCPSGKAKPQLDSMREKGQEWVDRAKEGGSLRRRDVWFLMDHQLWPKVGYGLCSVSAPWRELENCLKGQWWQIVPLGGVIRSAPREIRDTNIGFYGAGCPHVGVECLIAQLNKLQMHYGCTGSDGLLQKMSLELLIVELGRSAQPLQESYKKYGKWVTWSWITSLWEKCSKFDIEVRFNDIEIAPPREGDDWLMLQLEEAGFGADDLVRLNRVRIHQQVLFLSDILGASGSKLDERYLQKRPVNENWSRYKFPTERPPPRDFDLWRQALHSLVPADGLQVRLGPFVRRGHKYWPWRFDQSAQRLVHATSEGVEFYQRVQANNTRSGARWERVGDVRGQELGGDYCTTRADAQGRRVILSRTPVPPAPPRPSSIFDVLEGWGCTWVWDSLTIVGDEDWLFQSIEAGSCYAVTDGSFIREHFPDLCSAAFILECQGGRGRIVGAFPEASTVASAYRGELMGLMAIHLLLLAANKVRPDLGGVADIFSDCLGALDKVCTLPPRKIPTRCKHSDILKVILVNCSNLTFTLRYHHVEAHQDDHDAYENLCRPAQLNSLVDSSAKRENWKFDGEEMPPQLPFPLEPVVVYVGQVKMTSDTAEIVRFQAHHKIAEDTFFRLEIMSPQSFREVAWREVYDTLHSVPRLFQLWAAKQVMGIAGTNYYQSQYKDEHDPRCPSCDSAFETCEHILLCEEEGRVDALHRSIGWLDDWLRDVGTEPSLRRWLVEYARGRGQEKMEDIAWTGGRGPRAMGRSQDAIGWRRFMEGMISCEILPLQEEYVDAGGCTLSLAAWAQGLITKLLEATHGQWLYRNVVVHDSVAGLTATARKEEIQQFIEDQLERGGEDLDDDDKFLLDINLDDLETSSGEEQHYWLLQIEAARCASALRRGEAGATDTDGNQQE